MGHESFGFGGIDAVVGKSTDMEKKVLVEKLENFFHEGTVNSNIGREYLRFEVGKTPEDLKIIEKANTSTSKYRSRFRQDFFTVPEKNVHIFFTPKTDQPRVR